MTSTQSDFLECSILNDPAREKKKHEQISSKNGKVLLKKCDLLLHLCLERLDSHKVSKDSLALTQKLRRERDVLESKIEKKEESNSGLHEEFLNLRSQYLEKQSKVPTLAQELENLKAQLSELKENENEKRNNIDLTHKSILLTKDHYKRHLGCHVRIVKSDEDGDHYIFSFENTPPEDTAKLPRNSAKFLRAPKKGAFKLLETNPSLPNFEWLSKRLKDTKDIQGLLECLRSTFKKQRSK